MTLSEELTWRGFVNQTTYKDTTSLDGPPLRFYWGVDPSAPSMTVGNLAAAMMVRLFAKHGHIPYLLVGGATGLIGDPDGKADERSLKTMDEIATNKAGIAAQYQNILGNKPFTLVDNYDWFKNMGYLQFLRDIGKHVPLRQMVQREFVQSRISEGGSGISYAEFSYSLVQGYDFLHLYRQHGVVLQLCGADQWGNSIAGVELIRRVTGGEAHVYSTPLVVNKATGVKFGKSEAGAIWLNPALTTPTAFYQFWINLDDDGVQDYLKIYTELEPAVIDDIIENHKRNPGQRQAQTRLAQEVTALVHGNDAMEFAAVVSGYLVGTTPIGEATPEVIAAIAKELPTAAARIDGSIADALQATGLAGSLTEARRLLAGNAVSINGQKVTRDNFAAADFQQGNLLLKRGKKYKDTALVTLV